MKQLFKKTTALVLAIWFLFSPLASAPVEFSPFAYAAGNESPTICLKHVYSNDCDDLCNNCEAYRNVEGHRYTDESDSTCDICGFNAEDCYHIGCIIQSNGDGTHTAVCDNCLKKLSYTGDCYDNDSDSKCDECYAAVSTPSDPESPAICLHEYTDIYDPTCNNCGKSRGTEGTTGDCTWAFFNGHLVISGSGAMLDDGETTFANDSEITQITIEEGVTSLSNCAFSHCVNLQSISIPSTVTEIGEHAFKHCYNLTEIDLSKTDVTTLNPYTFYNCTNLNKIDLPESLTTVSGSAFNSCTALESIDLSSVTSIGDYAFCRCTALKEVTMPEEMNHLGQAAFQECENLESIVIPEGITALLGSAFTRCYALKNVTLPRSLKSIGTATFQNCTSLEEISFPEGLESIGNAAFLGCEKLTSITLPESLTSLDAATFANCDAVTEVTIPASLTTIPEQAFMCSSIETVHYSGTVAQKGSMIVDDTNETLLCATWHCTDGLGGKTGDLDWSLVGTHLTLEGEGYTASYEDGYPTPWGTDITTVTIGENVISICYHAFHNCNNITDVYYGGSWNDFLNLMITGDNETLLSAKWHYGKESQPICGTTGDCTWSLLENVLTIEGNGAMGDRLSEELWEHQEKITKVIVKEGVTSIGTYSFGNFENLTEVSLPSTLTSLGSIAFSFCASLEEITLPEGITALSNSLFQDCTALKKVSLPSTLTEIGFYCFQSCTSLEEITIPAAVKNIYYQAFLNCTSLEEITLPEEVEFIAANVFENCTNLKKVTLPKGEDGVNHHLFMGCTSLTEVIIPESIEFIFDSAFEGCESLTTITLPESIQTIFDNAFLGCENLTTVHYSGTEKMKGKLLIGEGNEALENATWNCAEPIIITGTTGDLTWTFCEGVLTISGQGEMANYDWEENPAPWNKDEIAEIIVEEGVTSIGSYTFSECWNLETVSLPESLLHVGEAAFLNSSYIEELNLPSTLKTIGYAAFQNVHCFTELILPESLESIGEAAFWDSSNLTTLVINEGVTTLPSAFGCCEKLTTVYLPKGLTFIASTAFDNCQNLSIIYIEEIGLTISDYAFNFCDNIRDVYYIGTENQSIFLNIGEFGNDGLNTATIHYGYCPESKADEKVHVYTDSEDTFCNLCNTDKRIGGTTGDCTWILEGTVLTISGSGAMAEEDYMYTSAPWGTEITKVILEEGVTKIGYGAFSACENLTEVSLPSTLESIGVYAFSGCKNLVSIELPEGLKEILNSAFYGCEKLASIELPEGLETLEAYAFDSCISLSEIDLPESIEILGAGAFGSCNFTTFTVPESITVLNNWLFASCQNLTEIILHEGITEIGMGVFAGCVNLEEITLPKGITRISENLFAYCEKFTSIAIPEGVTTIADFAFEGCTSLSEIVLPESLEKVLEGAFSGCENLKTVSYSGSQAQKDVIAVLNGNANLLNANWTCNGTGAPEHAEGTLVYRFTLYSFESENYGNLIFDVYSANIDKAKLIKISGCEDTSLPFGDCECSADNASSGWSYNLEEESLTCPCGETTLYYDEFINATCDHAGATFTVNGTTSTTHELLCNVCNNYLKPVLEDHYDKTGDGKCDVCEYVLQAQSGTTGDCTWTLDGTVLTIKGNGAMADYGYEDTKPWGTDITKVIFEEGVTYIGNQAFMDCSDLSSVILPSTLKAIGEWSFYGCSLTEITLPRGIETIGIDAFGSTDIKNVYYGGSEEMKEKITIISGNREEGEEEINALLTASWHCTEILGDASGDALLTEEDFTLIQKHINGWDVELDEKMADFNKDGKVNNKDLGLIQRELAGWNVTPDTPENGENNNGIELPEDPMNP